MIKKVLIGLALFVALSVGVLAYIASPFFTEPKFIVTNESSKPVEVIAFWRTETKNIGHIDPGNKIEFKVNDEAAMKFKAKYTSGKEVDSGEIYFTSGLSIAAKVNENNIELNYE